LIFPSPGVIAASDSALLTSFAQFIRDTRGQDMIEYALIAASMGLGTLAGMNGLATTISSYLTDVANGFNHVLSGQA
jgi:Flp pilus assembly pilin Flp